MINVYSSGPTIGSPGYVPSCWVGNLSNSGALYSSTWTAVPFTTEIYDTDNMHSNSVNNSRITINTPGIYQISGFYTFQGNYYSGLRGLSIYKNGTQAFYWTRTADLTDWTYMPFSYTKDYVIGDYLEMMVYQASGSTLTLTPTAAWRCHLAATWIAPRPV